MRAEALGTAPKASEDREAQASHLIELTPGAWALWRTVGVRGAGFPVDGLERLGRGEADALPAVCADERFQRAVVWQSRDAWRNAVRPVAAGAGTGSKRRRRLSVVATYWQRYCARCETVGFMGPMGWGELTDDGPAVAVAAGAELVASRSTHLEVWAVELVAEALAADPEIRPWIAPRRNPVMLPTDLAPAERAAWRACDGVRPAREVGPERVLAALADRGLISWSLTVPLGPQPEIELRRQVEALGGPAARARGAQALAALDDAREAIARASGAVEPLAAALDALDATLERLTGAPAARPAGVRYGGRTPCYEDCRRDVDVRLGPELRATLSEALPAILAGARWFCGAIADAGTEIVEEATASLREAHGSADVALPTVWARAAPQLRATAPGVTGAVAELQRRWTELIAAGPEHLVPRAEARFADSRPAWRLAAYHSPDVHIAAGGVDAIARGDFLLVYGDFHPGVPTIGQSMFATQHPTPSRIVADVAADVPAPRVFAVPDRRLLSIGARSFPAYITPADHCILTGPGASMPTGYRTVAASALTVTGPPGALRVAESPAGAGWPIAEVFAPLLFQMAVRAYAPLAPAAHAPRVTLGRSVLRRESWSVDARAIPWLEARDDERRRRQAATWAADLGMPRRVFALAPGQPKPIYVDFTSPMLTSILARFVTRELTRDPAAMLRVSEMLPTPDECWLTDAAGRRYVSELRLTAVDLKHTV